MQPSRYGMKNILRGETPDHCLELGAEEKGGD